VALVLMLGTWRWCGGGRGGLVDIETSDRPPVPYQLDVNSASWTELALLPGIGEMLARRVTQSRRVDGPFASHEQLMRVKGIGPKTLAAIRPYLLPIEGGGAALRRHQPIPGAAASLDAHAAPVILRSNDSGRKTSVR
jgi:hypothetical protein